jgi:peroxiredoxin
VLVATIGSSCRTGPLTSGSAPDFTLDSLNDGPITLSDLERQVVVIDFWATWCSPCVESLGSLQHLHEHYASQDVVVLAINVGETRDEIADFVADHGYTFSVLLDMDDRVRDTYGVQRIPHTLIVDRNGKIHYVPGGPGDVEDVMHELLKE